MRQIIHALQFRGHAEPKAGATGCLRQRRLLWDVLKPLLSDGKVSPAFCNPPQETRHRSYQRDALITAQ